MFTEQEVVEIVAEVTPERLRAWVRHGWVKPERREGAPVFTEVDVARARLLCELVDDMGVNEDAMPVVISLLDQVHTLRAELKLLARAIEAQPEPVREAIARAVRDAVA